MKLTQATLNLQGVNLNFVKTSCIRIPTNFKDEQWCKSILQDLTRQSKSYEDPTVQIIVRYFDIKDGCILIPRYYDVAKFGHDTLDYVPDGDNINFEFKSQMRNELQRKGFEMLTTETMGILKLPPGEGKTVVAIAAICSIGKKAIIFVHKDHLITQWIERFIQHSTVTKDDIGILKTDKCVEQFKKPIIMSTVQTMNSMIDRLPNIDRILLDAKLGFSLWDECHTTAGAPEYSKSSLFLPCKRTFGLSATPGRADQNHDVIWMHLGMVYEPTGESKTMKPKIIMLYFSHGCDYAKRYIYHGPSDANGKPKEEKPRFDITRYLSILKSNRNQKYIPKMKKIARQVYSAKRTTLLISDRIIILDKIAGEFSKNEKNDIGFFIPRSKEKRDEALYKQIVLSTPGSSRDGTDRDELDCLIMANPISNIPQAAGRICRYRPNKSEPIVFDLVDTDFEELVKRAEWRKKFYEEQGWEVEEKFLK